MVKPFFLTALFLLTGACSAPQPEAKATVAPSEATQVVAEEQPQWIEFRLETKDDVPALTGEHWLRVVAEGPSLDEPEQRVEKELRVISTALVMGSMKSPKVWRSPMFRVRWPASISGRQG